METPTKIASSTLREFVSVSMAQNPVFFIRLIKLSKSLDLLIK
mgnify:CR=1 FL=1